MIVSIGNRSGLRPGVWSLLLVGALAACATPRSPPSDQTASNPPASNQPPSGQPPAAAHPGRPAQAQSQPQPDPLRARYGSVTVGSANVPIDRPYEQLTPGQQRAFKNWYERMGDADEPPFPVAGLKAIYQPIVEAQSAARVSGEVFLEVVVDAAGTAQEVRVLESPSPTVARAIGEIAMQVPFKPARCEGQPCRMGFPVSVQVDQPAQ
jgi:hypothetical protein